MMKPKNLSIFIILVACISLSSCEMLKKLFGKTGGSGGSGAGYSYPWAECQSGQVNDCLNKVMQPIGICNGETLDRDDSIVIVPSSSGRKFKKEWITGLWGDLDFYPASSLIEDDANLRDSDLKKLGCEGYKHPNRTRAEKKLFWIFFLSSLTRQESGFNPSTRVASEDSNGLLQIDYNNGKAHGCNWSSTNRSVVFNPRENLRCGAKILANQAYRSSCGLLCNKSHIGKRNVYFGPLANSTGNNQKNVINDFKRHALRQIPWCDPSKNSNFGSVGQKIQKEGCNHVSNAARSMPNEIDYQRDSAGKSTLSEGVIKQ